MGKGSSKGHTPREAKDNLKSTQLLSVIDAISEGPVEGPVDGLGAYPARSEGQPEVHATAECDRCHQRRAG
ncbi:hypothetical protein ACN65_19550 [Escherichia coli]|nr:hypothetical protein ACN65_19550 [Escherichia coli]